MEQRAMIDLNDIEKYRENNRIEAKKALGGLPVSLWETYSAFANTLGGIILLGVEEYCDHTLHPVNLPEPELLVREFTSILNDRRRVSVNILSEDDVSIVSTGGVRIIAIEVPRAGRRDKPVYIGTDPFYGSYRRDGEGDYHCTPDEVRAMLADRAEASPDTRVLAYTPLSALDMNSVRRFREGVRGVPERLTDEEFLADIGASARAEDGTEHPTAAGLLMFGRLDEIIREFPAYLLDYREYSADGRCVYKLISYPVGDNCNLSDFCRTICLRMSKGVDSSTAKALCEAIVNAAVNSDYSGSGSGLIIRRRPGGISVSNPGPMRVRADEATSGGVSDPRNALLARLFRLTVLAGGGITSIYSAWRSHGRRDPEFTESFGPDTTSLSLPLSEESAGPDVCRNIVLDFLTEAVRADPREIASATGFAQPEVKNILAGLVAEDVVTEACGKYRLRA